MLVKDREITCLYSKHTFHKLLNRSLMSYLQYFSSKQKNHNNLHFSEISVSLLYYPFSLPFLFDFALFCFVYAGIYEVIAMGKIRHGNLMGSWHEANKFRQTKYRIFGNE